MTNNKEIRDIYMSRRDRSIRIPSGLLGLARTTLTSVTTLMGLGWGSPLELLQQRTISWKVLDPDMKKAGI